MARISDQAILDFFRARATGMSVKEAADLHGLSYKHAKDVDAGIVESANRIRAEANDPSLMRTVVPYAQLRREAKKALGDFAYFRLRYLGRRVVPWQVDAATRLVDMIEHKPPYTDVHQRLFVVLNCPPGSGKTSLMRDIVTWVIARNRSTRVLWGSREEGQSTQNVAKVRGVLEALTPIYIDEMEKQRRGATDAVGCLAADYGAFKPVRGSGAWGAKAFTVALPDNAVGANKESTLAAYGMDSGFLGGRYDVNIWDDVVDIVNYRLAESRAVLREKWDNKAESRVEPGGIVVLVGQRLSPDDLYRYCLDKKVVVFDSDGEEVIDAADRRQYTHICYPAHDESRCEGIHAPSKALPWPAGCLLDPIGVPWQHLRTVASNNDSTYRIVYQQEDLDPDSVLVKRVWIEGGEDTDGVLYTGCYDEDRAPLTRPSAPGTYYSALTVDPSGTKSWAVQAWAYNQQSKDRYLIATFAGPMTADRLLDGSPEGGFTGLLEDYWQALRKIGLPPSHVIIENNAAQRYLMDFDHFKRWSRSRRVLGVRHATTGTSKLDPARGVETLRGVWRHNQVRLPGSLSGRQMVSTLVREAMTYPIGATSDQLMAQWFFEWHLPRLGQATVHDLNPAPRPTWAGSANERPRWIHAVKESA